MQKVHNGLMAQRSYREHLVNGGRIERNNQRYRLSIPPTTHTSYTDAQLDDYPHEPPRTFSNLPPTHLSVRARFSASNLQGTAGFGFWNHPFSRTGDVLLPPCNVWFFYSSVESHLRLSANTPGWGFKASVLYSAIMPSSLMRLINYPLNALLRVPRLSRLLMSVARTAVRAEEAPIAVDMTLWHTYSIVWRADAAVFSIDGNVMLTARRPPRIALGFAAWIDNYCATMGDNGEYGFRYVSVRDEQWLELEIMDGHE